MSNKLIRNIGIWVISIFIIWFGSFIYFDNKEVSVKEEVYSLYKNVAYNENDNAIILANDIIKRQENNEALPLEKKNLLKAASYSTLVIAYGDISEIDKMSYYYNELSGLELLTKDITLIEELVSYANYVYGKQTLNKVITDLKVNNLEYVNFETFEECLQNDDNLDNLIRNNLLNKSFGIYEVLNININRKFVLFIFIAFSLIIALVFIFLLIINRFKEKDKNLSKLVNTDFLTGVYSRAYGYLKVQELIKNKMKFSLAILDIDNFKLINDKYGHVIGDEVLRTLSGLIQSRVRKEDIIIRFGGEEFLLVLPNTDKENAKMILDRLRDNISTIIVSDEVKFTFSAGVTEFNKDTEVEIEEIIQVADKLLYKAKNNGKNQVL